MIKSPVGSRSSRSSRPSTVRRSPRGHMHSSVDSELDFDNFDSPSSGPLTISDLQKLNDDEQSNHDASDLARIIDFSTVIRWIKRTASPQERAQIESTLLHQRNDELAAKVVVDIESNMSPSPAKRMKFEDVKVPKTKNQRKVVTHDVITPAGLRELDDLQRSMSPPQRAPQQSGPYKPTISGRAADMKFSNPITTPETRYMRMNRHPAVDIARVTFVRDETNEWMDKQNVRTRVGSDDPTMLPNVTWYQLFKSGMGIPAYVQLAALTHGMTSSRDIHDRVKFVVKALCTGGLTVVMLDMDAQPAIEPRTSVYGPHQVFGPEPPRAAPKKKKVAAKSMMNDRWGEVTEANVIRPTRHR